MWGLESWTSRSRSRLLWPSLGLVSKFEPGLGLGGYSLDYITDCYWNEGYRADIKAIARQALTTTVCDKLLNAKTTRWEEHKQLVPPFVTCACPEKQSVPWIHCIKYIFLIIQNFEHALALKIFTVIKYFLLFGIFEQLELALKTVCPEFSRRGGGPPPPPRLVRHWVPDLSSVVILKRHRENREEYILSNLPVFWVDYYISVCAWCDNRT